VIPEEVVMASSLFDKAIEKGRLDDARHVCAEFVKRHHPGVAAQVQPAIAACSDIARLHRWTLRVPEVSAADFLRLVTRSETSRPRRRRAPRPSRRSRSSAGR
jgi:hypothetical protein